MWQDPKKKFSLRVFDPNGHAVPPGAGVRRVTGKYPYSFFEIDNPVAGVWQVEISGAGVGATQFRSIGFEVNDRITLDVSLVRPHVQVGQAIEVRARLRAPFAVPKAQIVASVLSPSGKWSSVKFKEHVGSKGDPNEPATYTARIRTDREHAGQYLIAVDARRTKGSFTVELDELYRQRPGLKPSQMKRTVKVPAIRRRTLLAATADREGPSGKEPIAGFNAKPAWVPKNHAAWLKKWKNR